MCPLGVRFSRFWDITVTDLKIGKNVLNTQKNLLISEMGSWSTTNSDEKYTRIARFDALCFSLYNRTDVLWPLSDFNERGGGVFLRHRRCDKGIILWLVMWYRTVTQECLMTHIVLYNGILRLMAGHRGWLIRGLVHALLLRLISIRWTDGKR